MLASQLSQRLDREPVLRAGDLLPAQGPTQQADGCHVETLHTGASLWCWCVRHDWFRRLPVGSVAVACPHEGR
jgi:hypothetical protein